MAVEKRPVGVFDVDGSLYRSNLLVDLVDTLVDEGIFPGKIKRQFKEEYRQWREQRDRDPYVEYIDRLVGAYITHVSGTTVDELNAAVDVVLQDAPQKTYVYGRTLLNQIRPTHFLLAISGSPAEVVGPYVRSLGFHDFKASDYEAVDEIYTGKARAGHHNKDKTLLAKIDEHTLTLVGSIGMGDTESDIPMLSLVERPIAFNPNKELLHHAIQNSWEIVLEHKDTVYHIQDGRYNLEGNFGHYHTK